MRTVRQTAMVRRSAGTYPDAAQTAAGGVESAYRRFRPKIVWRRTGRFMRFSARWVIVVFTKNATEGNSMKIDRKLTKKRMEECQKMRVLPCGKPAIFPRNPQVFPTTSPQPVEKSVEFFAKLWKKPRLSRLFGGFSELKSVFDVVDKSCLVVF